MAVCNAEYEIITVDTGSYGYLSDSSVVSSTKFVEKLKKNDRLNIPGPHTQPGDDAEK